MMESGESGVESSGCQEDPEARAARTLLLLMSKRRSDRSQASVAPGAPRAAASDEDAERPNYVGQLQEICQRRTWPLPLYDASSPSDHVCVCKLDPVIPNTLISLCTKGDGSSKKKAKAAAAKLMLYLLKKPLVEEHRE